MNECTHLLQWERLLGQEVELWLFTGHRLNEMEDKMEEVHGTFVGFDAAWIAVRSGLRIRLIPVAAIQEMQVTLPVGEPMLNPKLRKEVPA